MHTQRLYPDALRPEELDAYLAAGWYRMGQAVFTCRFVVLDGGLYSTVWTRLPMADFRFRKPLRRLMSRNERCFRHESGPAVIDDAKEDVYSRYRTHVRMRLAPSLLTSCLEDGDTNVFDTREIRVYAGARLAAFSFFDVGRASLQSVIGVYDPDYRRFSLGFYTMLLEVAWAREAGLRYFYPGYVLPGYPSLDYKLRLGNMERFDAELRRWLPHASLNGAELPAERLVRNLTALRAALARHRVPSQLLVYPAYEVPALGSGASRLLHQPLILVLGSHADAPWRLVVTYDLDRDIFVMERCARAGDVSEFFDSERGHMPPIPMCLDLLEREERLLVSPSPGPILEVLGLKAGPV